MTVTDLHRAPSSLEGFTVEDLFALDLPEGYRTELIEGSFVVSPPPAKPHIFPNADLYELLLKTTPAGLRVLAVGAGLYASEHDYLIPDLMVVRDDTRGGLQEGFTPEEVLLAIEVVSPSSRSHDNVTKRNAYARFGLQHYWIADPKRKTLLILELGQDGSYVDKELLVPGQSWKASEPFEVTIDPAQIFRS
jgi:Uma2 family endonuclease